MARTLSIIIPTLNEAEGIGALLSNLLQSMSPELVQEIIVVDGGSTDGTPGIVADFKKVKLISAPRGRARQMNAGARTAQGEVLYFLHADTFPPHGFAQAVLSASERGVAGCFRLRFDQPSHFLLRIAPWFTQFRSPLFRGGDQSLFIFRELFDELGGYDERYEVYEDVEFIQRVEQQHAFLILDDYVITSARRFEINGTWKLYFNFLMVHIKRWLGAGPEELQAYYSRHIRG